MKSKKRNGVSRNQEAPPIYKQPNREPEKLLTLFDMSANDPQKCNKQKRYMRTLIRSKESRHVQARADKSFPLRGQKTIIVRTTLDVAWESQRFPSECPGRDFTGFNSCHLMCQYGLMGIVSARPRVKVLNPGNFDGLMFMKSQLLKHSVVIRFSNVRCPRFPEFIDPVKTFERRQ